MKKRYIVAGILILLSLLSALSSGKYTGVIFQVVIYSWILSIIASVEKKGKDGSLTGGQKAQVIITEILGSFVAALFYHYCWKDKFPIKDRQSSKYFWIILLVQILAVILTILFIFLFTSLRIKLNETNSWQNRLACLVHYNCVQAKDFEPISFKPYTKDSQDYTYSNYWFYFTYPQTWKVEYKKNADLSDKQTQIVWEFKFEPLEGVTSSSSSLPSSGTMEMYLYKPYYEVGIDGFINDVLTAYKDNITAEGKKIGQTYIYYLTPKAGSNFKSQYAVIGTYHTYLMSFDKNTPKEVEDKITKYLFQLIFFK